MTVSIRRMSAGAGYLYLLRSVAAGDGARLLSTPLTRYYAEAGTPPGRWMGSGLSALGDGQIQPGMQVGEDQLALLIGMGRDPVTGASLGRAYPAYQSLTARMAERTAHLDPSLDVEDRAAESARIEAEEVGAGTRSAVAGFDLTFSVPKSVSVLWGVADARTQELIVRAHHAAVADVIDLFEREVAATRAGIADRNGAVAQVAVSGVAAVAFDHVDSRAGDPQLHTHVVISNKVRALLDGRWRSLDGRPVFASRTAMSAHYNALLADRLHREIRVEWEVRERGVDRNPQWEIVGVGDDLISEFSSRTREIELKKDELIAEYLAKQGRVPSPRQIVELRARATLATRPPKQSRSLTDLTSSWRERAARRLGEDATTWAASIVTGTSSGLRAEDVSLRAIEALASEVVAAIEVQRSVWNHWNLMAETSKQTMDLRFVSTHDRETVVSQIVDAAQLHSVRLTPPEMAITPLRFQREDGSSVFRPRHAVKYSSKAILEAETRLLDRAGAASGPRVSQTVEPSGALRSCGSLSRPQTLALKQILSSGRIVDVLVGPAGAGKTTAMRELRTLWISEHGAGSVVGLAPSAAAAQALSDDLGVPCENTAKWLVEHGLGRCELVAGQLLIIDEATLAGTAALDRITGLAESAGAKVLLVGDPHQLQSVEAGGAFSLLADRRSDVPELTEVHRFTHQWEKHASLALRRGEVEIISTYLRHDRIREGLTDEMLDQAYEAWRHDTSAGMASILVAESGHAVRALNDRARAERLLCDGAVDDQEIELSNGTRASVRDVVITRRNQRTLRTDSGGWVKNGDRWRVTEIRRDGSTVVDRLGPGRRDRAVLPHDYVTQHLDLGYATTVYRAQGVTVDTSHVVIAATATKETLYVAMSRGRKSNIAYVALDQPDDSHTTPEPKDVTARTVLFGILQHKGANPGALQTMETEFELHGGIDRIAAELETIAAGAQHDRFVNLLRRSGLDADQHAEVVRSPAFGPLGAALRRAEAHHHKLEQLLPRIVGQRGLEDAEDIAAVLRARVEKAAARPPKGCRLRPRLIAGLIPEPLGEMDVVDRTAIEERKLALETRARTLVADGIRSRAAWTHHMGEPPHDPLDRERWTSVAEAVAAYRDRYGVTSDLPLGGSACSDAQRADRQRAAEALREARSISPPARHAGVTTAQNTAIVVLRV